MESIVTDVRVALRQLGRSRGFAAVAIITIALGIGANTAIFSVVNALLLRPPAGVNGFDGLVAIFTSDYSGPAYGSSSMPDVLDFQAGTSALEGVAAYTVAPVVLSDPARGQEAELALGQTVTGNYFDILRVRMALGRGFTADEGRPGGPPVIVLEHSFWQTQLGADPGVIGTTIRLAGVPFTVIGVTPPDFKGLLPAVAPSFFVSLAGNQTVGAFDVDQRGDRGLFVVGRLAGGASIEQVREQLGTVARGLVERYPDNWTDVNDQPRRVTVLAAREAVVPPQVRGPAMAFAAVLMAVVAAVLLICCANIANLLLVRATARQREINVRAALGAGRGRIVRQLLTESLVLAVCGAALGIALAWAGTRALANLELPLPINVRINVTPDLTVLAFTVLVAVGAGLVFGLAPALLATRRSLAAGARESTARSDFSGRKLGLRGVLAGAQVTVAFVLLILAGLLVRSLLSAQSMDPGFRTTGMLFIQLAQDENTSERPARLAFHRELRERLLAVPGVQGVSYTEWVPLVGGSRSSFAIEGYRPGPTEDMELNSTEVGPGYFDAMGVPLLAGREFTEADGPEAPRVAIVNEAFVRRYLGRANPVGHRLSRGGPDSPFNIEIVGLARDGKYRTLAEEPLPFVWLASDQNASGYIAFVVHASGALGPVSEAVRRISAEIAPDVAITSLVTAGQHLAFALMPQRAGALLLGLFGALGLALATLGIYGVMAFAVSRRAREIGVRLAVGAQPRDVVRMVVRQGMTVAAAGAIAGLAIAAGVSRLLEFLLFGIRPLDAPTFIVVSAIVTAVTLLANWLPARKTASVNPLSALRDE